MSTKVKSKAARNMYAALQYARVALVKPRLETQQLQMLLTLYEQADGITMQELANLMQADPSFVSRNTKLFGPGAKGRRIIAQRIDEQNPRYRLVNLTSDGREIVAQVLGIAAGTTEAPKGSRIKDTRCKD